MEGGGGVCHYLHENAGTSGVTQTVESRGRWDSCGLAVTLSCGGGGFSKSLRKIESLEFE